VYQKWGDRVTIKKKGSAGRRKQEKRKMYRNRGEKTRGEKRRGEND